MLVGLVGITGAALAGTAVQSPSANALALTQGMQPLLAGQPPVPHPAGLQALRRQVAAAQATFRACRYEELGAILPMVIGAGQASLNEASGQRRDQTAALLAAAYSLASELCIKLHDDALAWVTAERARTAAQMSGDPASIAEAARMASIAMRRHGHYDTAITLLTSTALDLSTDPGRPGAGLMPAYGSLLCTAAYTAAQHGSRGQALDLITEAGRAAGRLGGACSHSPFSSVNVSIYQIGMHTALGDAGTALDHARKIDLRSVPSPERQARFCVDTARAWQRFGRPDRAFQALQTAGRCAPEELHRSPVRALIVSPLEAPGREPAGLRELAARYGAAR
jgi:hypothetical protein